jgi:hypothetical protein
MWLPFTPSPQGAMRRFLQPFSAWDGVLRSKALFVVGRPAVLPLGMGSIAQIAGDGPSNLCASASPR